MTPQDIVDRVEYIKAIQGDPEAAHVAEDKLHFDLLAAIARNDCEDPRQCASEAIQTTYIEFPRWTA